METHCQSGNYTTMRLRIRELKDDRNWTLEKLSERCGLSVSVLSRLQTGREKRFNQDHVEALVAAFKIEPAELFQDAAMSEKARIMKGMFVSLPGDSQDTVLIFLNAMVEQMKAQ